MLSSLKLLACGHGRYRLVSMLQVCDPEIACSEDKRLEQFFHEAEKDTEMLDEQQKMLVTERLQLARQFLS